jgi:hypothetical protein
MISCSQMVPRVYCVMGAALLLPSSLTVPSTKGDLKQPGPGSFYVDISDRALFRWGGDIGCDGGCMGLVSIFPILLHT